MANPSDLKPGTPVTFPHRGGIVVGYVNHVEHLGNGNAVAICPGIRVHARPYPNHAPPAINWRVPCSDVTMLPISDKQEPTR